MSSRLYVYILTLVSAFMLLVAVWHVVQAERSLPDLAPPASPARSAFGSSIAAAGIVEAQSQNIAVGASLSGVVLEVHVPADEVGKRVSRGEPLFRVDDRRLRAELAVSEAKLAAAEATLKRLDALPRPESLPASEARVRSAQTTASRAEDDFKRAEQLFRRGVATEQELVTKRLLFRAAEYEAHVAEADDALLKAGAWGPDKEIARTAVDQARADADLVRTELKRTTVVSPVDGQVLQVSVRVGEFVSAQSNQALVVVGNVNRLHVRADVDENDISRFNPAAPAVAHMRGAPQHKFPLKFVRTEPFVTAKKSLTGDNTERIDTRVLQIIYAIDEADAKMYVGQQVDVFIEAKP
ncbi:MAG: HlyD family efflux transporter periplasmic adaptor subunit [Planctomycetia bacterium]|nr:HlyD family efflux transporter periplasmic adaptor subunit [Planctomycetia bacterium]